VILRRRLERSLALAERGDAGQLRRSFAKVDDGGEVWEYAVLVTSLDSEILSIVVWRRAHQFEARAKVSTRLLSIARFKAMSALRQRRMHEDLDQAHDVADPTENAEVACHKADRDKVLRHCITKLSPSHREVLDLVYYHEQPTESVAKIIGIPLNTVKTR
jgi:RNA polymerase sigma factor (sigma-70 family)